MNRLLLALCAAAGLAAQQHPVEELIQAARLGGGNPALKDLVTRTLSPRGGTAVWGQDFLFVTENAGAATLNLDARQGIPMTRIEGTTLWMHMAKLRVGVTHSFQYVIDGKPVGQPSDVAGYNPDSYPMAGVPKGKLSDKFTIASAIFDGMKANYWIYASPGVDPSTPSAMMVWQDGQNIARGDGGTLRLFTVTENLVAQKRLPPMVHVLIEPGQSPQGRAMRSVEYDTVSDRYTRFLLEEVLPEVEKHYKLRADGYSRGISGESSGGICSFTTAWFAPEKFARVHSTIGSYTSIQWRPQDKLEGGNVYPFKVRKEPKRNIRVWLSDGSGDLENDHGSWPLQNIQMANSLKMKEYDYHFRLGTAAHNGAQAALDLPESLTWLWRGYDPSKTTELFTMDPAEKSKPYYRVTISNRDAW